MDDNKPQTLSIPIPKRKKKSWISLIFVLIVIIIGITIISKFVIAKKQTTTTTVETSTTESTTIKTIPFTETEMTSIASREIMQVNEQTTWKPYGIIIAGGNGPGFVVDQLNQPIGFNLDDDMSLYIADQRNNRIVKWQLNSFFGQVVAHGNGNENGIHQLYSPSDVLLDKNNLSLIVCERERHRLTRVFLQEPIKPPEVILKTACNYLTRDHNGDIYISDLGGESVKRWQEEQSRLKIIAGGNERGDALNQLHYPQGIFVDNNSSVYVADTNNHRVVKWARDAEEGIVVAGGQGVGNGAMQLNGPSGLVLDHFDNIYVVDGGNARVMRFPKGSQNGTVIISRFTDKQGVGSLYFPQDILFDQQGNLYIVDSFNFRVLKFEVECYSDC